MHIHISILFFLILPIFWLSFTLNCKREAEMDIFLFVSGFTVLYFHYRLHLLNHTDPCWIKLNVLWVFR